MVYSGLPAPPPQTPWLCGIGPQPLGPNRRWGTGTMGRFTANRRRVTPRPPWLTTPTAVGRRLAPSVSEALCAAGVVAALPPFSVPVHVIAHAMCPSHRLGCHVNVGLHVSGRAEACVPRCLGAAPPPPPPAPQASEGLCTTSDLPPPFVQSPMGALLRSRGWRSLPEHPQQRSPADRTAAVGQVPAVTKRLEGGRGGGSCTRVSHKSVTAAVGHGIRTPGHTLSVTGNGAQDDVTDGRLPIVCCPFPPGLLQGSVHPATSVASPRAGGGGGVNRRAGGKGGGGGSLTGNPIPPSGTPSQWSIATARTPPP